MLQLFRAPAAWLAAFGLLLAVASAPAQDQEAASEQAPPPPDPGNTEIPTRTPGFSFQNASSGKVEDFALGESPAEIQARHQESMLRKYDRDGDGKLSYEEKSRQMHDHFVQHKRLIKQYDKNGNQKLDRGEAYEMEVTIYLQRLNFMKLYDENQDGFLDATETERMRRELRRRQELFLKNMDR
ncbi:MAG: hypothetical protein AAGK14_13650 [Verrucomicrobiota bacterium]